MDDFQKVCISATAWDDSHTRAFDASYIPGAVGHKEGCSCPTRQVCMTMGYVINICSPRTEVLMSGGCGWYRSLKQEKQPLVLATDVRKGGLPWSPRVNIGYSDDYTLVGVDVEQWNTGRVFPRNTGKIQVTLRGIVLSQSQSWRCSKGTLLRPHR